MPNRLVALGPARGQATGGTNETMSKTPTATSAPLWKRVGELAASSAFLLYLADVASERLSLTQAAFFMLAAAADASGKPATRTQLLAAYEDTFRGSVRNSYRQLMEPSRVYPTALSWLHAKVNPLDSREQFLCLTDEGKAVIAGALTALEPITARPKGSRLN